MLDTPHATLRARLRMATAADHDRVDALFSTLNLQEPHGLAQFFAAHLIGFRTVGNAMSATNGWVKVQMVDEMCDALASDLVVLGHRNTLPELVVDTLSHHAIDHIVLGSRLGSAVLKRVWAESTDPSALAACAYFSLPARPDLWRAHCDELTAMAGDTGEADRVVSDARLLFQKFERAYDAVT